MRNAFYTTVFHIQCIVFDADLLGSLQMSLPAINNLSESSPHFLIELKHHFLGGAFAQALSQVWRRNAGFEDPGDPYIEAEGEPSSIPPTERFSILTGLQQLSGIKTNQLASV